MKLQEFDIILVKFPFSDLSSTKNRPALLIKSLEGENDIFCQITTKKRNIEKYEIPIKKKDCEGDIRFDSYAYVDMITTLHESLILKKIGFIKDKEVKQKINDKLKLLLS
jgi:mRNA interferase MazF